MGMLYRKKRKRPDGNVYEESIWQMKYYDNGREYRESSETDDLRKAKTKLKLREGAVANDRPIPKNTRFSALFDAVIQDYRENRRRSISEAEGRIEKHLRPFFGNMKASEVTPETLRRYRKKRAEQGASAGTINRELSIIGKAFTLSDLPYRPRIEKLEELNIRKGFLLRPQVNTIKKHLPADIADLVEFLFLTGWRRGEALNLQWKDVNFETEEVTLEIYSTKNNEPRCFPFYQELKELLVARRKKTDSIEKTQGRLVSFVFHRDGERIVDFRGAWEIACKNAGLSGRLVHDLRRSAIKMFTEKGISEQHGMELAGHKTPSIYRRYNIVTRDDLRKAVSKLASGTPTSTGTGTKEAARGTISGTERI